MEVLVGEWSQTATPAGGEPRPGEAKATFEWQLNGRASNLWHRTHPSSVGPLVWRTKDSATPESKPGQEQLDARRLPGWRGVSSRRSTAARCAIPPL
jgi:hypothetical protein